MKSIYKEGAACKMQWWKREVLKVQYYNIPVVGHLSRQSTVQHLQAVSEIKVCIGSSYNNVFIISVCGIVQPLCIAFPDYS